MSLKHLASGSQQPPKVDGKLRLYSMEYCPFAQRARIVLLAKNLPHDIVNINLADKPDWYLKLHPEGRVPSLDTGSEVVTESLVVSDYLDEKYPEPPLYPKDPEAKKEIKELIKKIDSYTAVFHKFPTGADKKSLEEWIEEVSKQYGVFESELAARGTTFFGGDKPGMFDYMFWPFSERIEAGLLAFGNVKLDNDKFPLLTKWHKALLEDPAIKGAYNPLEKHRKYFQKKYVQNVLISYDEI